jgi:hypothetical protein
MPGDLYRSCRPLRWSMTCIPRIAGSYDIHVGVRGPVPRDEHGYGELLSAITRRLAFENYFINLFERDFAVVPWTSCFLEHLAIPEPL